METGTSELNSVYPMHKFFKWYFVLEMILKHCKFGSKSILSRHYHIPFASNFSVELASSSIVGPWCT